MTLRAKRWLRAIPFVLSLAAAGCGDDPPPARTKSCTPTCSAGYTCIMGACVAVCAPACEGGQSCAVVSGAPVCTGGDAGGDAPPSQDLGPDVPASDTPAVDDAAPDAGTPDVVPPPDVAPPPDIAPPPDVPGTCTPPCSLGYTCVSGACVALCNPPCGASETCSVRDGSTVCLRNADGGVDVPATMDRPVAADAPPGMDVAMDSAAAPCGMTGQPCCGFDPMIADQVGSCRGTNLCDRATRRCVAYTPEANECTATGECPAGQVCASGELCSGGTRSCLRCIARSAAGMLPAGAPCGGTIAGSCADGLCVNNRCTRTCVPGAAGDATCRAFNAGSVCAELSRSVRLDSGLSNPVTYGACIRSCARDADCMDAAGNLRCGISVRRIDDRYLQTCRVPFGTLAVGAACPLRPTSGTDPMMFCHSEQCFSVPTSMTTGYCSAFCVADGDCPAAAPSCREVGFFRPSGPSAPTQPIRMCQQR